MSDAPSELNDFGSVAHTSHLMKVLEWVFLNLLRHQAQRAQDSLYSLFSTCYVKPTHIWIREAAWSGFFSWTGTIKRRSLVRDLAIWCHTNHLHLNTSKTKELATDFGKSRPRLRLVQIKGVQVEAADSYKYPGLWLDNKLDWTSNTYHLYRKGRSRLYFLRKLRSFNICKKLLWMFYQSVVASVLFYTVVCWGGAADQRRTHPDLTS